jgi:hypothetical protein
VDLVRNEEKKRNTMSKKVDFHRDHDFKEATRTRDNNMDYGHEDGSLIFVDDDQGFRL